MKVIVFDLDDTLYDEYDYVRSGFWEVAAFLSNHLDSEKKELIDWMWTRLNSKGRGSIFDDLLKEYNAYTKKMARKCLSIYRMHKPKIQLPIETIECFNNLSDFPRYIVTDGNKIVQHNKIHALGLYDEMRHCYITHRYGINNSKPSPYCFLHIMKREKITPENIVYIGDNSRKDFVGIKPIGIRTIRIMRGQHKHVEMPLEYEAELRISSLEELPSALKKIWIEV